MLTRREMLRSGSAAIASVLAGSTFRSRSHQASGHDVCIVGSGFAGVFLGLSLAGAGVRTVIVEAGPSLGSGDHPDGAVGLFPVAASGDYGFPIDDNRTVAVGGTSRKWNGVVTRLLAEDFRVRSLYGRHGDWPIGDDDLASYYCAAERALGTAGGPTRADAEPARACAYPIEINDYREPAALFRAPDLTFFPLARAMRGGTAIRLADEEVPRFAALQGATLVAEHPVTRILTDGSTAIGVEARNRAGDVVQIRARYVVVAAGVVETVRLLLASRTPEFPNGLGNGHGLVGRRFNAHPRYRVTVPASDIARSMWTGVHRTYSLTGRLRRDGMNAVHADVHLGGQRDPIVDFTLETEPSADNRISLARRSGGDRPGSTVASLQANWTSRDRRTLERSHQLQREFTRAVAAPAAPVPDAALRWFHPAGGCGMGADEQHGVVDRNCQVFGMSNLFLAGGSVFPTSGSTNPTLTIVALSLRLADLIASRAGRAGRLA